MRVYNRSFDETQKDLHTMLAFLVDDYADKQERFIWSATRLGGWVSSLAAGYGHFFPSYMRENAQLWFNSIDELVGFAISENGNAKFYALVRRGHEFLYGEIIEWSKTRKKHSEKSASVWLILSYTKNAPKFKGKCTLCATVIPDMIIK